MDTWFLIHASEHTDRQTDTMFAILCTPYHGEVMTTFQCNKTIQERAETTASPCSPIHRMVVNSTKIMPLASSTKSERWYLYHTVL